MLLLLAFISAYLSFKSLSRVRYQEQITKRLRKIVIQALKGNIQIPWQVSNIIEDVRAWLKKGIHFVINYIFRDANMTMDWLSKFGHSITAFFSSDVCFSPFFRTIIVDDVDGRTVVRRGA